MASTFPTTLDAWGEVKDDVDLIDDDHMNDLRDAVEKIEAKVGINSSAVAASLDYKANNFFVTGRKLWLYENAAPVGWTYVSVTDKVLAIKGGSQAYNRTGGGTAGAWAISGIVNESSHTHNRLAHAHSVGAFTPYRVNVSGEYGSGAYCFYLVSSHVHHTIGAGSGNTTAAVSHGHTHTGNDRWYASVGIVITFT